MNIKLPKTYFLLVFACVINLAGYAQDAISISNLKRDSNKMATEFIAGNFKSFSDYTYPAILQVMGGAEKMAEALKKSDNDLKSQGMKISKITFGEPSKIVMSGGEWQTTILQQTEIKLSSGRVVSSSTLIAISNDKGLNWKFVDTSNKDITTLRKVLPNLSKSITIPSPQPAVRYPN